MKLIKINLDQYHIVNDKGLITHSTVLTDPHLQSVAYLELTEVKELLGEVDVEKIGYNESWRRDVLYNQHSTIGEQNAFIDGVKYGYSQCLKDNKDRRFTEEDIIGIVEKSRVTGLTAEYLIQSLQPTTSWNVEFVDGKLKLI